MQGLVITYIIAELVAEPSPLERAVNLRVTLLCKYWNIIQHEKALCSRAGLSLPEERKASPHLFNAYVLRRKEEV